MEHSPDDRSSLDLVAEILSAVSKEIAALPPNYVPRQDYPTLVNRRGGCGPAPITDISQLLYDRAVRDWVQNISDSFERKLRILFIEATSVIANILERFGSVARARLPIGSVAGDLSTTRAISLIAAWGRLNMQAEPPYAEEGDEANVLRGTLWREIERTQVADRVVFARMLTTMMGPDALQWLTSDSSSGHRRLQPHEFMRTNWHRLWSFQTQVEIEIELRRPAVEAHFLAKPLVALAWVTVAIASCLPPGLFLGESLSYLSSDDTGQFTLSSEINSHTIVSFEASSWPSLIQILSEAMQQPHLNAADMMWMGMSLIKPTSSNPENDLELVTQKRLTVFLSHRGCDAKQSLAEVVRRLPSDHGVFLDCMTLPQGEINRLAIYSALARAETIVLVDTPNFGGSHWCRKEAWFSNALALHGFAQRKKLTVRNALEFVRKAGRLPSRPAQKQTASGSSTEHLLKDHHLGSATHRHRLKQAGYSGIGLDRIHETLSAIKQPHDPDWIGGVVRTIVTSLTEISLIAPEGTMLDLWITVLSYSALLLASTSRIKSRAGIQTSIEQLSAVVTSFVDHELHLNPVFLSDASGYLALIAAAFAIDLACFDFDSRLAPAMLATLDGSAAMRDGLLLLDMRQGGPIRLFRLCLLTMTLRNGIGSIGIVQNGADPVHNLRVADLPLNVLPCVTLYPGMEDPFVSGLVVN